MPNKDLITPLYQKVERISRIFFLCKKIISSYGDVINVHPNNPFVIFCQKISEAYEKLDKESQRMINNEFFFEKYPGWWMKELSYDNFNKKMNKSMKLFLENLYENI